MSSVVNMIRTGPRGGIPVVLLHSAGLELSYWDRQITALNDDYDVVAFDLPGHGRTPGRPEQWELGQVTAMVTETIAALGTNRVHLAGLSLGGMLAQVLAASSPEFVASVTLIDTAAEFPDAGRSAMRARAQLAREEGMGAVLPQLFSHWFTAETAQRRPDLLDRATKTLLADDPLVHAAMWEMIAGFDAVPSLARISCPAMVLVGERDSSSPVSSAQTLRDNIADCRLHILPNTAHLSPLEKPDVVSGYLAAFLASAR